jgi:ABC-type transport system involved in multi-copper enzyme maturation permease subunit
MMSLLTDATTNLKKAYSPTPGPGNPWPLFLFNFKNILVSRKKTPLLLAFLLIPLFVTFLVASSLASYHPNENNGQPSNLADINRTQTSATGGRAWFQDILSAVFFPFLIPIVTAIYACGVLGEEVEAKTLPYLFVRPVYRSWTLLAKSLSFLTATSLLGILALTITYFVAVGITEDPWGRIDQLFGYWSAVLLAVFATGGLWLFVCVLMPRAGVITISLYAFFWETLLSGVLPSNVQKYSLVWYEKAYINSFIDRRAGFVSNLLLKQPDPNLAVTVLLVFGLAGLLASLYVVSVRDYNV